MIHCWCWAKEPGLNQAAGRKIAVMRKQLGEIGALAAPLPKRSVMFVVGRTPATVRDLVVVGRGSFLNELISIAGGTNCFEDAPAFYPRIPREEVYARGPQVIIDMGDMGDTQQVSEEHRRSIVRNLEEPAHVARRPSRASLPGGG